MDPRLAAIPATRWDRLVAVLEEVDPERAIDAAYIIERQKKLELSDVALFYLLQLRYRDAHSRTVNEVLSLYVLISTWVGWLKLVHQRFQNVRAAANAARAWPANDSISAPPAVTRRSSAVDLMESSSNSPPALSPMTRAETMTPLQSPPSSDSYTRQSTASNVVGGYPERGIARPRDATSTTTINRAMQRGLDVARRTGVGSGGGGSGVASAGPAPPSPCSPLPTSAEVSFDLGDDFRWDGSLDFVRDGKLMYALVVEVLRFVEAREQRTVQTRHTSPNTAKPSDGNPYNTLFPPLHAVNQPSPRASRARSSSTLRGSAIGGGVSFGVMRQRSSRRSRTSRALQLIEQQGKSVIEVEECVAALNYLCEMYLGWNRSEHNGEDFMKVVSGDRLVRPLNGDDLYLVLRLHWLAIALYKKAADTAFIPVPPRVGFIAHKDDAIKALDTSEEDNEIAIVVATKCSCMPHNQHLDVTVQQGNVVHISHRTAHPQKEQFPCALIEGEAFAFAEGATLFIPIWDLLAYLLRLWDSVTWSFELSSEERKLAEQLLPTNSPRAQGEEQWSSEKPPIEESVVRRNGGGSSLTNTKFELTIHSSTAIDGRRALAQPPQRRHHAGSPHLMDAPLTPCTGEKANAESPHCSPAMSVVRRGRTVRSAEREVASVEEEVCAHRAATPEVPAMPVFTPPLEPGKLRMESSGVQRDTSTPPLAGVPHCVISPVVSVASAVAHTTHVPVSRVQPNDSFQEECISPNQDPMGMYSECNKVTTFSATVVLETEDTGIAIREHRFRVSGKPVGKGAFGAVYRALDLETGNIVAVKQSRYTFDNDGTNLNWREFQNWSMLPLHPNVISFHGACKEVETHQLLLVMEYASGGSIVSLYQNFRPIPEHLFYRHARGMALGLKHLHDHNVIHGDVKPENVLTRSDGSVAISDFGCSRLHFLATSGEDESSSNGRGMSHSSHHHSNLSGTGSGKDSGAWQLFGTAAYMAPEVILNEPHVKSDVWAYACTLIHLWLWETPWSGDPDLEVHDSIPLMFHIANEEVIPYTAAQIARTPRWVQRIADRAFVRDVDNRCNMAEVLSILTEYSVVSA